MEDSNFLHELKIAVNQKTDWFNTTRLQDLVTQYRLKYTCIHNLYDTMAKKNVIIPDPYRFDKNISKIIIGEGITAIGNHSSKRWVFRFRYSKSFW